MAKVGPTVQGTMPRSIPHTEQQLSVPQYEGAAFALALAPTISIRWWLLAVPHGPPERMFDASSRRRFAYGISWNEKHVWELSTLIGLLYPMTKESKSTGSLSLERMRGLDISQDSLTTKPDTPTVFETQIVQRIAIISRHCGCFL